MAHEDYEHPAELINGDIQYVVIHWDKSMEMWGTYAFSTTKEGATDWASRARSKGSEHVRVFKMNEIEG